MPSLQTSNGVKEFVSNQVYELRIESGITQETLADAVGVTRQTIIAIEKGNYAPSVLLALRMAKFFKKQLEEIFSIKYEK
ncbi:MAG: helix-turn-helix transcriptional regulator [Candidatus Portnoybacteria bacterium]|nr:helix-turn-helix transcriptional regulator [Candidatus Portnoybacteria bacterium]